MTSVMDGNDWTQTVGVKSWNSICAWEIHSFDKYLSIGIKNKTVKKIMQKPLLSKSFFLF